MSDTDTNGSPDANVQQLLDRQKIRDVLHRYARGVDRGDWELVRSTYHPDATDNHGPYKGDVDGLLIWLGERFDEVVDSSHFLGQTLVDFTGRDTAFVETYFVSRRLITPPADLASGLGEDDRVCREVWGRYADDVERRDGHWAVSTRTVIVDARFMTIAYDGRRRDDGFTTWGHRGPGDLVVRRGTAPARLDEP